MTLLRPCVVSAPMLLTFRSCGWIAGTPCAAMSQNRTEQPASTLGGGGGTKHPDPVRPQIPSPYNQRSQSSTTEAAHCRDALTVLATHGLATHGTGIGEYLSLPIYRERGRYIAAATAAALLACSAWLAMLGSPASQPRTNTTPSKGPPPRRRDQAGVVTSLDALIILDGLITISLAGTPCAATNRRRRISLRLWVRFPVKPSLG